MQNNGDRMYRAWINLPSTLQHGHQFHGTRVLAHRAVVSQCAIVYLVAGDVVSMRVPLYWLSEGWPKQEEHGST